MPELSEFLHYSTIALSIGINAIGVGIGQGLTGKTALDAINLQPKARPAITKTAILGMVLIETAAVTGALASILLLRTMPQNSFAIMAELGIALAICIPGIVIGIVSSWPAQSSCFAIARQPFLAQQISRFMTITQALIQAPIIFGLLTALLISAQAAITTSLFDSLRLISTGACIAFGSIGPAIGLALFATNACKGLGINPKASSNLLSFTFISAPIIETPIIFSLIISFTLLFSPMPSSTIIDGVALLAAGLCTGFGTIGTGISTGMVAASASNQIALNPDSYSIISRTSTFSQCLIETCSLYAVLISFLLIFLH